MSYFNHAFGRVFIGTKGNQALNPGTAAALDQGFLMTGGVHTSQLANAGAPYSLGPGVFGMFNKDTYQSLVLADLAGNNCCSLVLASASLMSNDKIGPFAGGYQESNKSKYINPKTISRFYKVPPCTPQQAIVHVGNTNYTETLNPLDPACCFEFYCDETYYLTIQLKGSPVLRFANHNIYRTLQADGGCCDGPVPTLIDSTLIMIQWAKAIVGDPYLQAYVQPIVFDEAGNPWFATDALATAAGWPSTQIWDNYVSPGHTPDACAGLRLLGAFVETKFGNCSFQLTDHYEVEPVKIIASMVDLNGDPCAFTGICVYTECPGLQGMGFGESAVRELILSESYLQNKFSSDIRIREITQGDQILNTLNRQALYTRYFIQHHVPRFNNPSGIHDNDQYLLEIITNGTSAGFEAFMAAWLSNCTDCTTMETFACTPCTPVALPPAP